MLNHLLKLNIIYDNYNFLDPKELQGVILTHCSTFYGSNLWDLAANETQKVFNLWNSSVRDIYNLPRTARTYLIENVCSIHHGFRLDILSRFQNFAKSLFNCLIAPIRILAAMLRSDVRSVFGQNIAFIAKEAWIDPLVTSRKELIRKLFKRHEAPANDEFMIDVVHKLYEGLQMEESDQGRQDIKDMIYIISMSWWMFLSTINTFLNILYSLCWWKNTYEWMNSYIWKIIRMTFLKM